MITILLNLILIQSIINNNILVCASGDELLAASIIFRHGDRMPGQFYQNDPHKNSPVWDRPLGDLTNLGKRQHYELGQWFRKRYDGFISREYKKNEIYVRSSDIDRCIASAAANLAGFYPPEEKDVWNPNLPWQPIPIHTVPTKYDGMIFYLLSCPKFTKLLYDYLRPIHAQNQELLEYLTNHTGQPIPDYVEAMLIGDTLDIEKRYNLTLPEWTREVYPEKLEDTREVVAIGHTANFEIQRLVVGQTFHHILKHFEAFSSQHNSENYTHKLRMYSGHASNIENALRVLNKRLVDVPLAAALLFELRRNETENYVQLIYKTNETQILEIGNCDRKCRFEDFVKILEPFTLTEDQHFTNCKIE